MSGGGIDPHDPSYQILSQSVTEGQTPCHASLTIATIANITD